MLPKFLRVLWGDLTPQELKKFGILAATFFLIIGNYWMLRVMKDAAFDLFVGYEYQPFAKMASVIFVGLVVLFYSKLVDLLKKDILFYAICLFYGIGFMGLAYFMAHSELVSADPSSVIGQLFAFVPGKMLGWLLYLFLESFGSIVPAMFWGFVASTTTTASAKRGYGMIMSCTQLGVILGPFVVTRYSAVLGLPALFGIGGALVCIIPLFIKLYITVIPAEVTAPEEEKKPKTGMLEGLRLLFSHTYLLGVFVVVTTYEVISTIVEYQMGMCIKEIYPAKLDAGVAFAWFKALNGVAIGMLSFTFALLGTSFFMRRFGLRFCLILFPATIGITLITSFLFYLAGANLYVLMWVFFAAVVIFKGVNYALNVPTKEVMYIPTSKDVKFKAKGWIDAFGNRTLKTSGAFVTASLRASFSTLIIFGTIASLGIVGFWMVVAAFVGNKFNMLQKENKIIE